VRTSIDLHKNVYWAVHGAQFEAVVRSVHRRVYDAMRRIPRLAVGEVEFRRDMGYYPHPALRDFLSNVDQGAR
jgi:hypothetical protein